MPSLNPSSQSLSLLLQVLQKQIVPWVREKGMDNVIVAAPSWKKFQQRDAALPEGASAGHQALKSRRVAVKAKRLRGDNVSLVNARWPQDGLCSTTVPVLCFVVAGPVALPLGDYVVHCLPGHAVLMPGGTPRPDGSLLCLDESRLNNGYCSMLSFMPWAGGVECWMNHTHHSKHSSYRNPREHCYVLHPLAHQYLETLEEEAVAYSLQHKLLCDGLLMALLAILMREIHQQRIFHPLLVNEMEINSAAPSLPQGKSPISRAQTYIDSHLKESLSIDQVAGHVYMSRAYFTRQFRRITGKTFIEYVTQSRLEKAKVLLQNTNWSFESICISVGVSPGRLRSIFWQYEHQTPGDFRRANRGDQ